MSEGVGRQPAGPRGHEPARRRGAHAGRVGELAAVAGLRLLRLRRGHSGSEMVATPSAGHGPWRLRSEPSRQPTPGASRADLRPTRQRPNLCQGPLDAAGRSAARSTEVRVDGRRDGDDRFEDRSLAIDAGITRRVARRKKYADEARRNKPGERPIKYREKGMPFLSPTSDTLSAKALCPFRVLRSKSAGSANLCPDGRWSRKT